MRKILIILIFPCIIMLSGCFGISDDFRNIQKEFARYSGIKTATKDIEFSLGRFSLYFAEKLTGYVDRDLLAEMTIHDISNIEVGVYEIREYKPEHNNLTAFEESVKTRGWIKFIKTTDGKDLTNIYINLDDQEEEIREIMVVTMDSENVILMRLKGNFNRIVERLIKARKLALK